MTKLVGEKFTSESGAGRACRESRAAHIAEMAAELLYHLFGNRLLSFVRRRQAAVAAKHDEQVSKRRPNHVHRRGTRGRALAAPEVAAEELVDERLVYVCHRATRPAKPTGEVLDRLHVLLDR